MENIKKIYVSDIDKADIEACNEKYNLNIGIFYEAWNPYGVSYTFFYLNGVGIILYCNLENTKLSLYHNQVCIKKYESKNYETKSVFLDSVLKDVYDYCVKYLLIELKDYDYNNEKNCLKFIEKYIEING